jgi:Tol biopolymer transport system component
MILIILSGIGFLVLQTNSDEDSADNSPSEETTPIFELQVTSTSTLKTAETSSLHTYPQGTILFSTYINEPAPHTEYYLMNADGTPLANIGEFTGFSAWSPDGKTLAIGCADPQQICILDMTRVLVYRSFPIYVPENYKTLIIQKLDLPAQCKAVNMSSWGINSLSWSRDGKRLIVVCESNPSEPPRSEVCIVSLSNASDCWTAENTAGVNKAAFSPTEDILAISRNGMVEIVDEAGNSIQQLIAGTNPAWSPDGKRLVYFAYYNDGPRNGIGIINKDGTNSQWLYLQPGNGEFEEFLCALCEGYFTGGVSWSPDGKYITFSADYLGNYTICLFLMNVETKEITILVGLHGFFNYPGDPNWGSIEYR